MWQLMPDGRWVRNVELSGGGSIHMKIDVNVDGWTQGMALLKGPDQVELMNTPAYTAYNQGETGAGAGVVLMKTRLNLLVPALRAIGNKTV